MRRLHSDCASGKIDASRKTKGFLGIVGNQHVIELNGKRYDAMTGEIITADPPRKTAKQGLHRTTKAASIDGFTKTKKTPAQYPARHANQVAVHKVEKSKTLMRKTVAKPKPAKSTVTSSAVSKTLDVQKPVINQKRLEHAKTVPKSTAITRFSVSSAAAAAATSSKASLRKQPVTKKSATHTAPTKTPTAHDDLVSRALSSAVMTATMPLKKDKRSVRIARRLHLTPRQVSVGGFTLAFILVIGFFAYQNSTNISMRIASSRAGMHGNLPSYQPAGFTVAGGIAYSPGQITIPYKSTSDNRNFRISQNVSEWNSQALLDNYVAANHPTNQTIQDRGKTIYLYDGSNATWVDGGIWYRIEGDSQLNSSQLLNIAASL